MYKKSRYNIEIDKLESGKILVYNTNSGILGIMDEKTKKSYDNIEQVNVEEIEDIELRDNLNTMISHGYVVDKSYDELASFSYYKTRNYLHNKSS